MTPKGKTAKEKALDAASIGLSRFRDDLDAVDMPDADRAFEKKTAHLPKGFARRVNRILSDFDEWEMALENLVDDLDCAASDAMTD